MVSPFQLPAPYKNATTKVSQHLARKGNSIFLTRSAALFVTHVLAPYQTDPLQNTLKIIQPCS
jgi:hypothetical protein